MTMTTRIKSTVVEKHREKHPGASAGDTLQSLKHMRPEIAEGATEAVDGDYVVFTHKPCPKWRVLRPLSEPFDTSSGVELWKALRKADEAALGINGDTQTHDLSRIFFYPRFSGEVQPVSVIIDGPLLSIGELDVGPPETVNEAPEGLGDATVEHLADDAAVGLTHDAAEDLTIDIEVEATGSRSGHLRMLAQLYGQYIQSSVTLLQAHGYELTSAGDGEPVVARLLAPTSASGVPGVRLLRGRDDHLRVYSSHTGDDIAETDHALDIIDLIALFDYDDWRTPEERNDLAMRRTAVAVAKLKETTAPYKGSGEDCDQRNKDWQKWLAKVGGADLLKLLKTHAFCKETNKWVDLRNGTEMVAAAFNTSHAHRVPEASGKMRGARGKCICDRVGWWPGKAPAYQLEGCRLINAYKTPALLRNPQAGDTSFWTNHLKRLIPDRVLREYLIDWMAFNLQHPELKINHHPLIGGDTRIGKDFVFQPMIRALEPWVAQINEKAAASDFEDHLINKLLVVVQEIHSFIGKQAFEDQMKSVLASPPTTLMLNPKGKGKVTAPNLMSWVMFTNRHYPLNISANDERLFCIWSPLLRANIAPDYWPGLWGKLNTGGDEAIVRYLLERNVSHFNPAGHPPMTEWKADTIEHSGGAATTTIREPLQNRSGIFALDLVRAVDVEEHALSGQSKVAIADALKNEGCQNLKAQKKVDGFPKTTRVYSLRDHEKYAAMSAAELHDAYWQMRLNWFPKPNLDEIRKPYHSQEKQAQNADWKSKWRRQ
jgi:hypothetical protein